MNKDNIILSKRVFWLFAIIFLSSVMGDLLKAQGLRIGASTQLNNNGVNIIMGNADLINQGILINQSNGKLILTENWKNDGIFSGSAASEVIFNGTTQQEIGGSNATIFGNLTLSNNAGFLMSNDITVNGTLDFQHGILSTGNYLVTIGGLGTITNANATRFIEGKLANTFGNVGTRQFPIGKDGKYRPLTVQFSALTGTSIVTAEQFETALTGALPEDATLMTTSRHWRISQSGGSGLEYFVTLDATDYTPSRPVVILKQDAGTMVSSPTTAPEYTNSSPLSTFSDFGLGEVCKNPVDGGTLAGAQTGCSGFDPGLIRGTLPSGHAGVVEYKWQKSTTSDLTGFNNIENSDSANYDPDAVSTTTWFRRLARVDCKTNWTGVAISNAVKITVDVTPPVVVAKSGASVSLDPTGNYILLEGDLLDSKSDTGIGIESVTIIPNSVNCADLGLKTITVTVIDSCGNQTVVSPQITVAEGTAFQPPWVNANTAPAANGSATYSPCTANGTFRLTATGNSTTTNDVMHYVYQEIGNTATIIARLEDVQNNGWAGVMMRESNAPGAKTILFKTRLYNPNVYVGYRATMGKSMTNISKVYQMIRWMKIQRNGNTFQVFVSYNGTSWTRSYTATISMSNTINAGIFTESSIASRTSKAWFDNVELTNTLKSGDEFSEMEIVNLDTTQVDVQIYPNPAKDVVNLNLAGFQNLSGLEATLISTEGKTMKTFTLSGTQTHLNVRDLKPGVYILRVENADNVVVKRLVIQ